MQKRVSNVYVFQLSFHFAYHHWWLGTYFFFFKKKSYIFSSSSFKKSFFSFNYVHALGWRVWNSICTKKKISFPGEDEDWTFPSSLAVKTGEVQKRAWRSLGARTLLLLVAIIITTMQWTQKKEWIFRKENDLKTSLNCCPIIFLLSSCFLLLREHFQTSAENGLKQKKGEKEVKSLFWPPLSSFSVSQSPRSRGGGGKETHTKV